MNIDQQLDARQQRRMAAQDRQLARLQLREGEADRLIGVLIRGGKPVLYVNTRNGSIREGSHADLIQFLVRNRYV